MVIHRYLTKLFFILASNNEGRHCRPFLVNLESFNNFNYKLPIYIQNYVGEMNEDHKAKT